MNRRTLLKLLGLGIVTPSIVTEKLLWTPGAKTIVTAPVVGWSANDAELYLRLPFYLAKMEVHHTKLWKTWDELCGKKEYKPNLGVVIHQL